MSIEAALLLSGVSVAFGIWSGITNKNRNDRNDNRNEASALTTVLIKLENISAGVTEIKTEISGVKSDVKDTREQLIAVDASVKQAHKRLDTCERYCKRFTETNE